MCVIMVSKGEKISQDIFNECWDSNRDGFGMAWASKQLVYYVKGIMDRHEAWKAYNKLPAIPHVCHWRIATAGGVNRELTHPFLMTPESPIMLRYKGRVPILFHNGVVYDWKGKAFDYFRNRKMVAPSGPMSDTRFMAMLMDKEELRKDGGKYVILSQNDIILFGTWEDYNDNICFSNNSYVPWNTKWDYGYWDPTSRSWERRGNLRSASAFPKKYKDCCLNQRDLFEEEDNDYSMGKTKKTIGGHRL